MKLRCHATAGSGPSLDADQKLAAGIAGNIAVLMAGAPPQVSTMDCSSLMLGTRQSVWPAKVEFLAAASALCQFKELAPPVQVALLLSHVCPSAQRFHIRPVLVWMTVPSVAVASKSAVGVASTRLGLGLPAVQTAQAAGVNSKTKVAASRGGARDGMTG